MGHRHSTAQTSRSKPKTEAQASSSASPSLTKAKTPSGTMDSAAAPSKPVENPMAVPMIAVTPPSSSHHASVQTAQAPHPSPSPTDTKAASSSSLTPSARTPLKGSLPLQPGQPPSTAGGPAPAAALTPSTAAPLHSFTDAELQGMLAIDPTRHLVVIRGMVYDVTNFLDDHPGGASVLRRNNGKDVTDAFYSLHGPRAVAQLPQFLMGKHVPAGQLLSPNAAEAAPADAAPPHDLSLAGIHRAIQVDSNRLLLILFGDVYDITPMRNDHPGGLRLLLNHNGKECGDVFMRIHGLRAKKMVQQYYLGRMPEAGEGESPLRRMAAMLNAGETAGKPLHPRAQSTRILEKEPVNAAKTIQYFTFACPKPLRLAPGGHIKIFSNVQRDEWRYYSPFQSEVASFKVAVKHYPQGRTSTYLFDRREGEEVYYEGPFTPSWQLATDAIVQGAPVEQRHVLLVAGGTGIAPMYSILHNALTRRLASVTLVCSVHTPDDLLLAGELEGLAARFAASSPEQPHVLRIAVAYTRVAAEAAPPTSLLKTTVLEQSGKHVDVGFLKALRLPPTQAVVICGPPAFNDALAGIALLADVCPPQRVHCL